MADKCNLDGGPTASDDTRGSVEVLSLLPETVAQIGSVEGAIINWYNVIVPKCPESVSIIMPLNRVWQVGAFPGEVCRVNERNGVADFEVNVTRAFPYVLQCNALREVFNLKVRFVDPSTPGWLLAATNWIAECREFQMTYGSFRTPRDLLEAYEAIEVRLFKLAPPSTGKFEKVAPKGAYAVLFPSTAAQVSFSGFNFVEFCNCEENACKDSSSRIMSSTIRLALDPCAEPTVRAKAKDTVKSAYVCVRKPKVIYGDMYVSVSRPWHAVDDHSKCDIPAEEIVFGTSSMHIVHWISNGQYEHAVVVGPMRKELYCATVFYIKQMGMVEFYGLARNDFPSFRFDRAL